MTWDKMILNGLCKRLTFIFRQETVLVLRSDSADKPKHTKYSRTCLQITTNGPELIPLFPVKQKRFHDFHNQAFHGGVQSSLKFISKNY